MRAPAATVCVVAALLGGAALLGAHQSAPRARLNQVIEQLEQGKPAFANQHWQFIDMEHSPYSVERLVTVINGLKPDGAMRPRLTPVVRIPFEGKDNFDATIKQVLDTGVMGVVVPHVESREQAVHAVRAARYPPQRGAPHPEPPGIRGWGPFTASKYWGLSLQDYALRADLWPLNPEGELVLIVMIESPEGVKHVDEILSVPGLGGVLIGPSDLSLTLGVGTPAANPKAPEVETATAIVVKACVAHKVACGTFESPDPNIRVSQGFRLFPTGSGSVQYVPGQR
jgi:4-hydroxy-2-oxoheptanedioate aldolase